MTCFEQQQEIQPLSFVNVALVRSSGSAFDCGHTYRFSRPVSSLGWFRSGLSTSGSSPSWWLVGLRDSCQLVHLSGPLGSL